MKTELKSIISGVTFTQILLLAVLFFISGCTSPKVLGPRRCIPAPMDEPVTLEVKETETLEIPTAKPEIQPEVKKAPASTNEYPPIDYTGTPGPAAAEKTYTVVKNDNLWKIARQFGVSFVDLAAYNNIPVNKPLYIGKVLRIPPATYKASSSEKAKVTAGMKRRKSGTRKGSKPQFKGTPAAVTLSGGNKYVVRNGDNPWLIARRFKVKLSDLLKANGLNSKSMLKVGQTLVIPSGTVIAPAAVTPVNKPVEKKEESLDSLLDSVDTPETPANKPAATPKVIEEKAVAPVVPAAAPAQAPKAKDADEDLGFGKQIETISDTTVARLAAKYNTTVEKLQLLNPTIPEDGNIKKGTLIQLPK